ncbi:hypothetical protein EIK77_001316 [Talaromyces pinophilus]|nr:hypothetical protein EIK77_001316 [Talaromyces pinophilus]
MQPRSVPAASPDLMRRVAAKLASWLAIAQNLGGKGISKVIPVDVVNGPERTTALGDIPAELGRMVIWRKGEHVECCEKGGVRLIPIIVDYIDNLTVSSDISVNDDI